MRTSIALVALVFLGTTGCGASVLADPDDGGPPDTGGEETAPDATPDADWPDADIDSALPPPPDGGPITCGFGPCSPGYSCSDGCNSCYCNSSGSWSCTTRWCEDAGPPPDVAPPPVCPPGLPPGGATCPGPLKCAYKNSCGSTDYASCDYAGGRWMVSPGPCTTPSCPTAMPKEGTTCAGPAKCEYWKACGTSDLAYCESASSKWKIYASPCPEPPPPPPPSCPTSVPKEGSACSSPWASCAWNNGCGSLVHGYCEGGRWWLSNEGCSPGCPAAKPTSGLSCKPPSSSACTYVTSTSGDGYCTSNCFCAEDARWACISGGCSSGGGGGWDDAGPPMPY